MKLWSLILLFGVCSRWPVTGLVNSTDYVIHMKNKTLNGLILTGSHQPSVVELSGFGIEFIRKKVFDKFTNITRLDLARNKIQKLPSRVFSKLINLTELSLADNNLSHIGGLFTRLGKLKILNVSRNQILSLDRGDLYGLRKSATVLIAENNLEFLSSLVFQDPSVPAPAFETESQIYHEYEPEDTRSAVPLPDAYQVKICKTDGIMESVEHWRKNVELGYCTIANIQRIDRSIDLSSQNLVKFRRGWYKLPRFAINGVDLSRNSIPRITSKLLNDLPQSLITVNLASNSIEIIRRNIIENSYLRTLIFDFNSIEIIEDGAFEGTNITTLSLHGNELKNLAFAKTLPRSIKGLDVSANSILDIPVDAFINLENLELIDLNLNLLKRIEPRTFANQKNLLELRLDRNNLTEFNSEPFESLEKLKILDLSLNRIEKILRSTFSKFQRCTGLKIDLSGNNINAIEEGSFFHLDLSLLDLISNRISDASIATGAFNGCRLQHIILSGNLITKINSELFRGTLGILHELDLAHNQIRTIEKGDAKYLSNVRKLNLNHNPLKKLDSGALYGLSRDKEVMISLKGAPIEFIKRDLFHNFQHTI